MNTSSPSLVISSESREIWGIKFEIDSECRKSDSSTPLRSTQSDIKRRAEVRLWPS
jgi:hypothetical protein